MRITDFVVELHGNKEVSLNGKNIYDGGPIVEEKVIRKSLSTEQKWMLMMAARKLAAIYESVYRDDVKRHEKGLIVSGAGGVQGTTLGKL